jgi:VWFA-related protein
MRVAICAAAVAFAVPSGMARAQQPATPKFQAGVEIVPIDVTVVDGSGRPVQNLGSTDFTVRIDGQPRRVVSAEFVSLPGTASETAATAPPDGFSSNERATAGRLILIVVDQPNIPFTEMRPLQDAAFGFIDRLSASDRTALIGFGTGAPSVSFTADHERLKQALARMPGQSAADGSRRPFPMGLSTALAIERGDSRALAQIRARDCTSEHLPPDVCESQIRAKTATMVLSARLEGDATVRSLSELLTNLKVIDAPKTLILISGGFFVDQSSGDTSRLEALGPLAAAARTSIYGLQLEEQHIDITQTVAPLVGTTPDHQERRVGLEVLTAAARGALFNVTGTGTGVFDRLRSELSGYYLLGVESDQRDRDGKPHPIRVDVARRGVTVRARRTTLLSAAVSAAPPSSPGDAVAAALRSPLVVSTLPLKGIVFTLRGADPSQLQLLVHAEIGAEYSAPRQVSVALEVLDRQGQSVGGQISEAQLTPASPGIASPLAFTAGAPVAPGEYVVKLAVADGDRVGSIEMPVHASLVDAGAVRLTELIVGDPLPPGDLPRPTMGSRVSSGGVHGYLEAYGTDSSALHVRFEVAAGDSDPALLGTDVAPRPAGADRALFSQMMPVQLLPPGAYRLRARIAAAGMPEKLLTRAFEIVPPPHAGAGSSTVFLPVELEKVVPRFRPEDTLIPSTLQQFRNRVPAPILGTFEQGLASLQDARFVDAGVSFRNAIEASADGTAALAPLVYLGVCLAATEHDMEAESLWRQAMGAGAGIPQLHQWLGDALMRTRDFGEARTLLEAAARRWPSDTRFARPLAVLYAISGKGRDAVRSIEQVVAANPTDLDAVFLGLQWLFVLDRAGVSVHSREEDLQLARVFAGRYAQANEPSQPLAAAWLTYLEKEKR